MEAFSESTGCTLRPITYLLYVKIKSEFCSRSLSWLVDLDTRGQQKLLLQILSNAVQDCRATGSRLDFEKRVMDTARAELTESNPIYAFLKRLMPSFEEQVLQHQLQMPDYGPPVRSGSFYFL